MNIISNNCCGGYFYDLILKESQPNPFRYNWFDVESCFNVIKNWDNIDFTNYELEKDSNWNFKLHIDRKIHINCSHHLFDAKYKEPTKVGENIRYCKIWEYIIEKYNNRVLKMKKKNQYFL